jgi:2-isopropylmalate synthase
MSEKIRIFDTTLRDGEQSAGVAFTALEKRDIAKQLEALGVDVIEAGFPCATPGDLRAVQAISREVKNATVCALARAVAKDIDIAWEAIRPARDPRIHVFINTSDIQMAHQLRKGRDQVLDQAEAMVRHAARYTSNVEFSPMDATRSDPEFLWSIIERCIAAGATTINVPDSVGYAMPDEVSALFTSIFERVPNVARATLSFHGQNDLGLCTANSLAAIKAGARQVEVTVNGIGERAGNTSLEEVVMAIRTREDFFGFRTDIDTKQLWPASQLVERLSGMDVQYNKAVVGKNAFRHGSGIHQDGILKLRETWEIMDPNEIGIPLGTQLVLGKLSGRHAFRERLRQLGHELDDDSLQRAFNTFKALADEKVELDDRGLSAIVMGQTLGGAA